MKKTTEEIHMSINIQGILEAYRRRSMAGLVTLDDGTPATDAQVREFLYGHLKQGHELLPMCDTAECPDFDYSGGGCPGHGIHYYDDNDNEISKEEYEAALESLKTKETHENH